MKAHIVSIRLSEAEFARIACLPPHPADRSDSDTLRRLLAAACELHEKSAPAASERR